MEKDFFGWAKIKQEVQERKRPPFFGVGQIWWCSLGANVGNEQDGKGPAFVRPVVVLTKFNEQSCLVIPLTGRERSGRYYVPLGDVTGRPSSAILSQVRLIDSKRLLQKIGSISRAQHATLKNLIVQLTHLAFSQGFRCFYRCRRHPRPRRGTGRCRALPPTTQPGRRRSRMRQMDNQVEKSRHSNSVTAFLVLLPLK
jgi:mRNA interferase MazF